MALKLRLALFGVLATLSATNRVVSRADEAKAIPPNRVELKAALERLKQRQPRLPVPSAEPSTATTGERRPNVFNGRARREYLPAEWFAADFRRDDSQTLDYAFKTRVFWIVSRGNNCHYCLGHQEHKLAAAGMTDDQIAALDSRWQVFPEAEQAAFDLAVKLTLEPQSVTAGTLAPLRAWFSPSELIELVYTISFYNSVNRWTDSLGLPQDQGFGEHPIRFDQPTLPEFASAASCVIVAPPPPRGDWESAQELSEQLQSARTRRPAVELPTADQARVALGEALPAGQPVPVWIRPLAHFPETARQLFSSLRAVATTGRLPERLKAKLAWVAARENRSWYALGETQRWLDHLGAAPPASRAVEADPSLSLAEQAALRFALKLTAAPQTVTDDDIALLRKQFGDHEVAEIVYVTATANFFDRFTEALELPLEGNAP